MIAGGDARPSGTETSTQFKNALLHATRDAGFTHLVDLERKTGLSHSTVSAAFSPTRPLPSAKTVHAIVTAFQGPTQDWEVRRQAVADEPTELPRRVPASGAADDLVTGEAPRTELDNGSAPTTAAAVPADPARTVAPADVETEQAGAGAPSGGPAKRRVGLRTAAIGLLVAALTIAVVVLVVEVARAPTSDSGVADGSPTGAATADLGSGGGSADTTVPPDRWLDETVIPENAAPTLKDPRTSRGLGPKIPASATVKVSCRFFSDVIPSAYPDGFWYRIESAPWNGDYYAAANVFLNGDPPGDVTHYTHATDLAVPLC